QQRDRLQIERAADTSFVLTTSPDSGRLGEACRRRGGRRKQRGGAMVNLIKTPAQLLAYRPLKELLAAKPKGRHSVRPTESVLAALQLMADHGIGFLVVLDGARLVGVMSERDYARKVILRNKSSKDTTVRDIMTESVVTVTPEHTVPQCMALMDKHGFRHLPVVENGAVIGVLSIRDLLKATVAHHERLIRELETELVTTLNPNVSGY